MRLWAALFMAGLVGCSASRPPPRAHIPLPSGRYALRFGMPAAAVRAAIPGGTARKVDKDSLLVTAPAVRQGRLLLTTTGIVRGGRLRGIQVMASLRRDGEILASDFTWHQERFRDRCAALYGWAPKRLPQGWLWRTEALEAQLDLPPPALYMEQVAVLGALTLQSPPKKARKAKPKPKRRR